MHYQWALPDVCQVNRQYRCACCTDSSRSLSHLSCLRSGLSRSWLINLTALVAFVLPLGSFICGTARSTDTVLVMTHALDLISRHCSLQLLSRLQLIQIPARQQRVSPIFYRQLFGRQLIPHWSNTYPNLPDLPLIWHLYCVRLFLTQILFQTG